jgi:hypothetical protein
VKGRHPKTFTRGDIAVKIISHFQEKLMKIGAKAVIQGRCVRFLMAEVTNPTSLIVDKSDRRQVSIYFGLNFEAA